MKEITPFIYSALFKKRFDTFEEYQNVFSPWIICLQTRFASLTPYNEGCCDVLRSSSQLSKSPKTDPIEYVIEEVEITEHTKCPVEKPSIISLPSSSQQVEPPAPLSSTSQQVEPPAPLPPNIKKSSKYKLFEVKKPDSLFWSIFIGKYGLDEFFAIKNKYMNREMEEKTKIIDSIKSLLKNNVNKSKEILKKFRLSTKDINEIMGDLMSNKTTNLSMIPAFVTYYKQPIWVIHETTNSYLKYEWKDADEDEDHHTSPIVIFKQGNKYSVTMDDSVVIPNIQRIQIEKPDNVMKSVSSYKMTDLTKMANILCDSGNQIDMKQKKQELYLSIYRLLDSAWI